MYRKVFLTLFALLALSCNSSDFDALKSTYDDPDRKPIDPTIVGVNAFVNDSRFGSIAAQFAEIRDTLKLKYVRILFAWNDQVQASPGSSPVFGFYDDIADNLPSGLEAMVVITGLPSWMSRSANWTDGNPRTTFVDKWVKKVVNRYRGHPRIVGWQIWNEPNMDTDSDNTILDILGSPANYVEMLARAYSVSKDIAPGKLVITTATTSINQNFPESLNYNREMQSAGAETFADVWAVHYYGKQYEKVLQSGGIKDFLNGISRPIWITESGSQGVNKQLAYVEQAWPFLKEKIPGISRIFYYQFAEATPAETSYGLRTLDPDFPVSDLYLHLRDR